MAEAKAADWRAGSSSKTIPGAPFGLAAFDPPHQLC
jgi:hypothetical protein